MEEKDNVFEESFEEITLGDVFENTDNEENFAAEEEIAEAVETAEAADIANPADEIERLKAQADEAAAISARMKAEYENAKRAEKMREKLEARKLFVSGNNVNSVDTAEAASGKSGKQGVSAGTCIFVSVITVIITAAILFVLLFTVKIPAWNMSFMQYFVKSNSLVNEFGGVGGDYVNTPSGTVVGGTEVPGGSDVTINIDGTGDDNAAAVYAKCDQSVVGIRVVTLSDPWENSSTTVGEGSGVIYTADGYIITNHHVIADAIGQSGNLASGYEIRVYFDKTLATYSTAKIIGSDAATDLAVVKVQGENLTPITVADSESVAVGDKVFAIGSPGGLEFMNSLSDGIVSGLDRTISTDTGVAYDLIQTNTAINPGNSGGALLNAKGELIGVCFLKIVADGYEGMGFAISSDTVKDIVAELMENGKVSRPMLGVTVNTTYTETEAQRNNLPAGAWVVEVTKGSAADKAGVDVNNIITEMNGTEINNYNDLRTELLKYKPGDEITMKLYCYDTATRGGVYKTVKVILDEAA